MTITPSYAAILTLLFVVLSFRVVGLRRSAHISLGDGGNAELLCRQRVHSNFAEYVPLALLLMTLAELQGMSGWFLHGVGLLLLAGRIAHAYGLSQKPQIVPLRVLGMILTFTALIASALGNLAAVLSFI